MNRRTNIRIYLLLSSKTASNDIELKINIRENSAAKN